MLFEQAHPPRPSGATTTFPSSCTCS